MVTLTTQIKLDIDGRYSRQGLLRLARSRDWREVFRFAHPRFGILRVVSVTVRRTSGRISGGHWHVVVTVSNEIAPEDLSFLQAVLDSDVARECLNRRRIFLCPQQKNWNLLFPNKITARGDIVSQEVAQPHLAETIRRAIRDHQRMRY
jgi:hypothetical protein